MLFLLSTGHFSLVLQICQQMALEHRIFLIPTVILRTGIKPTTFSGISLWWPMTLRLLRCPLGSVLWWKHGAWTSLCSLTRGHVTSGCHPAASARSVLQPHCTTLCNATQRCTALCNTAQHYVTLQRFLTLHSTAEACTTWCNTM